MIDHKRPIFSSATRYFLTGLITFVLGFGIASFFPARIPTDSPLYSLLSTNSGSSAILKFTESKKFDTDIPLSRLKEAYEMVSEKYYGFSTVSKDAIVTGMIRGMVESLGDPHSVYFDEEETKKFNEALSGNFEGIGAYVGKTASGVLVNHTFDGTPAKEAGINDGDIIESANGVVLKDMTIEDAVSKIRGPAGSEVTLVIVRPSNKNEKFEKKLKRRHVQVPSVISNMVDKTKIGMIRVGIFGETTPEEFNRAYNSLTASGMQALILDLRDNPGGLLGTSVTMLSNFVESGKMLVETRGIDEDHNQKYFAEGGKRPTLPIVVLMNENSASASEITAGALQDYGIAVIVGSKSYGKGSVQEAFRLK